MNRSGDGSSPNSEPIESQRTGTSRPRPAFRGAMREFVRGNLTPKKEPKDSGRTKKLSPQNLCRKCANLCHCMTTMFRPENVFPSHARAWLARVCWLLAAMAAAATASGGNSEPRLSVGQNANGQLELFRLTDAGQLNHRWRKESNGAWSAWANLGGSLSPGIAIVNNAEGEMEIFGVDRANGSLQMIGQTATNSLDWSDWLNLGGTLEPPVAAGRNADGRLAVFAVDARTHHAKSRWQTSGGDWSDWTDLGGSFQPGLLAAQNTDGRLEIFGRAAADGALLHSWQPQPNAMNDWSRWSNLGGTPAPGMVVGRDFAGRLEVFASRTNGEVLRIREVQAGDSTRWTAWENFGGGMKPALAVASSTFGRLELLAVNATNAMLLHRWELYTNSSGQWSAWAELGARAAGCPAVAANAEGDLEVFAADPDDPNRIHYRRQFSSANDWLDWSSLDRPVFGWFARSWQVDAGLPDNLVQAITQTTDGFLWIGTRGGLARFDGYQFVCYDSRNTPALKNSSITALCASGDGALWIGTDGGGLVRLKNGVFSEFSTTNGMAGDAVQMIFESRDKTLWIGTTTGMSRYRDGAFRNFSTRDGLLSNVIRCIYEDRDGNLWIATGKGLNRMQPNGTMDAFAMPNGLPNDSVRAICQDRGGRIWIGSNNGLLWYEWFWKTAFYAYNTKYGLSDTFVSAICEDNDGNLWVGTYSGLNRFRDGLFYSQFDGDGQPFDRINALFVDREGDLWAGSKEGLSRLTPKKIFTYTKQQGLTHNNVMSVLQDKTGSLWIGTWGGGVDELHDEQFRAYASTNMLSQDLILSLCEGRDGSLWIGADFDGGLTRLKNRRATHYTAQDGLINAGLRVLHEDAAGNLWIGTDRGMSFFRDGKFSTNRVTERLAGESVRDICEERSGALWFATQNGLHYWQGKQLTTFTKADGLSDNSLTALFEDGDGTLWIGTSGGGLIRGRNGAFTAYTTRQGLFSDEIFSILEDDQGWLWMSCSKGIFRVRKKDLDAFDHGKIEIIPTVAYGKYDGMESPQCNGGGKPSAWKSSDGRLWFPTSKGLVTVDPKTLSAGGEPPAVFIETVVADAKTIADGRASLSGAASALARRSAPLRVPPGHGEMEFQYAALDFSAPEKVRFQYRLDKVDAAWMDAGTRRTAYYNNLAPGTYRFQVRSCNADGVWNENGATMTVILRPHYWQTWWFEGILASAIIGGAAGMALYSTRRRMQRKLALLEQQQAVEKERGRIAKDMHDQIGAGLTQISLLGEFARRAAKRFENPELRGDKKTLNTQLSTINSICATARELAQTLDEIVWMVNPRNDTLNKLGAYLAAYAEEFFHTTDIRCRLDIPPSLPAAPLPADVRHNLFLTVQEALNNIVKHSCASEARLGLVVSDSTLEIEVEDNGVGFAVGAAPARHGVSNMQERIKEIGGQIEIASAPRKGTRISLRIPVKPPERV